MTETKSASVARLNDMLRTSGIGGEIFATPGVTALSHEMRARVVSAIRDFDDFTLDNDPYSEHDFGSVDVDGAKYLFKIDAYDPSYRFASEDPFNPAKTRRVMTIMRADEY